MFIFFIAARNTIGALSRGQLWSQNLRWKTQWNPTVLHAFGGLNQKEDGKIYKTIFKSNTSTEV